MQNAYIGSRARHISYTRAYLGKKDLMKNIKSENISSRSTLKEKIYSDYNIRNILLFKRLKLNLLTWRNFTICIQKLSRKLLLFKKCYGLMLVLKKLHLWKNKLRNMVNNVSNSQEIWKNGRLINSWNLQSKTLRHFSLSFLSSRKML